MSLEKLKIKYFHELIIFWLSRLNFVLILFEILSIKSNNKVLSLYKKYLYLEATRESGITTI